MLHVQAGNGGHGCASVHREKFKPLGGPDGGDGGNGGDVTLVVDHNVHTLLDFHFHPHAKAGNGKPGAGDHRDGAKGESLELTVPDGTVVLDADGNVLADLIGVGSQYVAAHGGRGGLGNAALASRSRKAPGFALLGEPGQPAEVVLELKSVADVGLVGFPSAGKSSLVSVLSAAKPKIADYPFTTLQPNLGVVTAGAEVFTIADVPGLIPGASQGRGLGLEFLRHIERCAVLVHVVDCATFEARPRPRIRHRCAGTRAGRVHPVAVHRPGRQATARGAEQDRRAAGPGAGRTGAAGPGGRRLPGVPGVHRHPRGAARADASRWPRWSATDRESSAEPVRPRVVLRPEGGRRHRVHRRAGPGRARRLRGPRASARNAGSGRPTSPTTKPIGYLADRLARLGVEEAARQAAAPTPGCPVTIGDVTFDWEPTTLAGVECAGPAAAPTCGWSSNERIGAAERKAMHRLRRGLEVEGHDFDETARPVERGSARTMT